MRCWYLNIFGSGIFNCFFTHCGAVVCCVFVHCKNKCLIFLKILPSTSRSGSRGDSAGLLKLPFGAAILNCYGDVGYKVGNYHITTLAKTDRNELPFWKSFIRPWTMLSEFCTQNKIPLHLKPQSIICARHVMFFPSNSLDNRFHLLSIVFCFVF
jgi:hypothetical protein